MLKHIVFVMVEPTGDTRSQVWLHEARSRPSIFEEAVRLVVRFFQTIREKPEAFRTGLYKAIQVLERAIARVGANLAQLELTRRKIFKEARAIITAA